MGNCCEGSNVIEGQIQKGRRRSSAKEPKDFLFKKFTKTTDLKKKYDYISVIGSGAFGKVRLYVDKKCRTLRYAIKTIKKDIFNKSSIEALNREIEILRSLDHPNIVKYFETYEDEKYLHIVMEYIPGDNLFKVLTNQTYFKFTEREISQIMTCLFKAVLFLHHNGIIHRDIKPENIVFIEPGNFQALKLIDFGLSISQNSKKDHRRVGTPYYMSPEMIQGNFVYSSDVWSIGVILFIMVTGKQPFNAKNKDLVFEKISNGIYDSKTLRKAKCSSEVKDLIKKMLVVNPDERFSIEQCLEHQWFRLFEDDKTKNIAVDGAIIESLKQFQYRNLFQKEILYYLAKLSDDRELVKLKQAFSAIDKDNSGEIEYEEIPKIFGDLGIEASDVSYFFPINFIAFIYSKNSGIFFLGWIFIVTVKSTTVSF